MLLHGLLLVLLLLNPDDNTFDNMHAVSLLHTFFHLHSRGLRMGGGLDRALRMGRGAGQSFQNWGGLYRALRVGEGGGWRFAA